MHVQGFGQKRAGVSQLGRVLGFRVQGLGFRTKWDKVYRSVHEDHIVLRMRG